MARGCLAKPRRRLVSSRRWRRGGPGSPFAARRAADAARDGCGAWRPWHGAVNASSRRAQVGRGAARPTAPSRRCCKFSSSASAPSRWVSQSVPSRLPVAGPGGEPRLLQFVRLVLGVARQLHEIEVRLGLPQSHLERLHQVRAGNAFRTSSRAAASRATSCPAAILQREDQPARLRRVGADPPVRQAAPVPAIALNNGVAMPSSRSAPAASTTRGGGGDGCGGVRRPDARPLGLRLLQPARRSPASPARPRASLPHVDDVAVRPLVAAAAQRHRPGRADLTLQEAHTVLALLNTTSPPPPPARRRRASGTRARAPPRPRRSTRRSGARTPIS